LLLGDDQGQGLHLYAAHPELQIGPLAFLAATPLRLLGATPGRLLALIVMSATGPFVLYALWRLVPSYRRRPSRLLIAGLLFLPVWAELVTHAGHLDDVLALVFAVAALHALTGGRPVAAGLLIAASADSKPWAAAILGCLLGMLAVTRGRRTAVIVLGTAARILLDPEVYSYYTAGILLGAVAYDLVLTERRWPWLTTAGLLSLHVARLVAHVAPISLHVLGLLRVGCVIVVVATTLPFGRRSPVGAHEESSAALA
jgi:hypothetical protein